ncbi:MAG TPA: hypothetical protein VJU87_05155 [Gemmatimonadaceae bacterium]|nr:hypothetical protein [Gemmatimonadaceae bacterium]
MVEKARAHAARTDAQPPTDERRRRVALRRLVDEMLAEIRAAANADNWTTAARQQAQRDLERIMEQVRLEALSSPPTPARGRKRPAS